jgi:NTP pyrophosphatase (non-canonical NTP hydrolase)
MTLKELQKASLSRCEESFHRTVHEWSALEWGGALAGEVGELCNLLKKLLRGDRVDMIDIAKEIADVQCYLPLVASRLQIDLEQCTIDKFNEVSDRVGSKIKL